MVEAGLPLFVAAWWTSAKLPFFPHCLKRPPIPITPIYCER